MKIRKLYVWIGGVLAILILFIVGLLSWQFFKPHSPPPVPGVSKDLPIGDLLQQIPLPTIQQIIMDVPGSDASAAAYDQYRANVEFNAIASDKVTLVDCVPNPMVLKVVEGSTFTLENRDIKEHRIIVNSSHTYRVNPKSSIELTADFGSGLGIYTYFCDDTAIPAGVFLVRESL